ncbi:MAG TPA: hydrogenase maturation protease [Dissulfurispiraceae bacterium]|nr:hydrogenase maturation protease [Dissulfurispiraceae bacterium]
MAAQKILVIGYGNPLRGDDGFGVYASEQLQRILKDDSVNILTVHQLGPELAEDVSEADFIIFMDVHLSSHVGEQRCRRVFLDGSMPLTFSHHMKPGALLACAQAIYGTHPQAVMISVGSNLFDHGPMLSPIVEPLVAPAADLAKTMIEHISEHGVLPELITE